jgi:hypothetical protein
MTRITDRDMEKVYRYVPMLGWKRAIAEVAQGCEATAKALAVRYHREMAVFIAAGGY